MTDQSATHRMCAFLEQEAGLLKSGQLDRVIRQMPEKLQLVDILHGDPPRSRADARTLALALARSERLLAAAVGGVRAAAGRLRTPDEDMTTYDASGAASRLQPVGGALRDKA